MLWYCDVRFNQGKDFTCLTFICLFNDVNFENSFLFHFIKNFECVRKYKIPNRP